MSLDVTESLSQNCVGNNICSVEVLLGWAAVYDIFRMLLKFIWFPASSASTSTCKMNSYAHWRYELEYLNMSTVFLRPSRVSSVNSHMRDTQHKYGSSAHKYIVFLLYKRSK